MKVSKNKIEVYKVGLDLSKPLTKEQLKHWGEFCEKRKRILSLEQQEERLKLMNTMVEAKPNQIVKFKNTFQLYGNSYDAIMQTEAGTMVLLDTKNFWMEEIR